MGSLERHDGFKRKADSIMADIRRLRKTPSVDVKRDLITSLYEKYELYKGMYITEQDIYYGLLTRGPRKFILEDDGFTYTINPEWKVLKQKETI